MSGRIGISDEVAAVEAAWYELQKGELGLEYDPALVELVRVMLESTRDAVAVDGAYRGPDGAELFVVDEAELARRVAAALSVLFYGVDS